MCEGLFFLGQQYQQNRKRHIQYCPGKNYFALLQTCRDTIIQEEKLGPAPIFEWAWMLSEGHYEL